MEKEGARGQLYRLAVKGYHGNVPVHEFSPEPKCKFSIRRLQIAKAQKTGKFQSSLIAVRGPR